MKESLARLNKQTLLELTLTRSLTLEEQEEISTYCNLTKKQMNCYQLEVKSQKALPQVFNLLGKLPVRQIQTKERNLEDVFEYYTEEG